MVSVDKEGMVIGIALVLVTVLIVHMISEVSFSRGYVEGFKNGSYFTLDLVNENFTYGRDLAEAFENRPIV